MLVDSDRLFCAALGALLSTTSFRISAEYTSLADATVAVRQGGRPDLILLNCKAAMPTNSGCLNSFVHRRRHPASSCWHRN